MITSIIGMNILYQNSFLKIFFLFRIESQSVIILLFFILMFILILIISFSFSFSSFFSFTHKKTKFFNEKNGNMNIDYNPKANKELGKNKIFIIIVKYFPII